MQSSIIEKFKVKYPDRIPIVVVKYNGNKEDTDDEIKKSKFLVPKEMQAAAFLQILRKYIDIKKEESLIFFVDNVFMLPLHQNLLQVYEEYQHRHDINKKKDYLCLTYSKEQTFG